MKKLLTILFAIALGLNLSAQTVSPTYDPDVDGDNNIGINDLLALLSLFAENDEDDDGIWDSQDDCVGEFDICGVCNGEGIPDGYDSCDEFYGACEGETSIIYHGFEYDIVQIGNQCWFAENLRNEHYANGDTIASEPSLWQTADNGNLGLQAVYAGDSLNVYGGSTDAAANLADYGRLYNWYAVNDSRGVCPVNWHVPSDGDFMTLEIELGMSESDVDLTGWRGTNQGTQMKSSAADSPSWNGSNTSGFSGLPGGYRNYLGYFEGGGYHYIWTSSSSGNAAAWSRRLWPASIERWLNEQKHGYSVRCIKD